MRADSINIEKSIQVIVEYLVENVMKAYKCNKDKALCEIMKTSTYELLQNKKSKLYAETPEYVLSLLQDEVNNNIDSWLKI